MTLPVALSGSDVIGQAKTGTGKTLGFGLPLLERVTVPADVEAGRAKAEQLTEAPQALVVVPTRELCQQVTNDLLTAGKVRNVRVLSIYGGRAYEPQVEALKKGVDVVVGTPGRLLDLAGQKKLNLSHVKALVLDEADEMLDLGFLPDVERIINMLPARRQTMLFSATMPGAVIGLARRYMSQPTHIRAAAPDDEGQTVANIKQHVFRAHSMDKPEMVTRILQANGRGLAMIFCRTKRTAADIADQLARRGFASGAVHGDLGQGAREQALRAFRNGKVDVLVCTDVAARGIDVEGVTHVINYQSPEDEKTYLHRIGRTGRAGAKGTAVTLVDWDDIPRWKLINKALDLPFDEPEETYSTSPHLYELLEIPEGTTGVLPRAARTRAGLAAEEVEDLGETGGRGRGGPRRGAAPVVEEERPRRTRTPRQRRRTRNGAPVDGAGAPEASGTAEGGSAATDGPRQPRRRRRTRGGSGSAPAAVTPVRDEAAPAARAAESIAPEAGQATDAAEAPAKPRRRRTRGAANAAARTETAGTATTTVDTAEAPAETVKVPAQATGEAPAAAEAPAADEAAAPAKPRRRTRSAKPATEAVVETVESAEPVADEAPAKPRRTRKTAATKKAEAAVETVESAEPVADAAPAAPSRARKTAAKKATAAVDTAEGAEAAADEAPAKPRRTRKTAATKKAETAVETAEGTEPAADEAPAKPRRTRKTAATKKAEDAAEAAEPAVEEAAAKPRRTRKTAAAKKAEAAVDTAEGAETATDEAPAKPRRTRKTAAKKTETAPAAEADTAADEAPAKPRRTRKTAAAKKAETAPAAEADTAADEAPAKPRGTRKTAAKKATAEAPAEG
ncbi:DEAD/DEAH box helicase [Streptomyces sp. CB02923]|uniref:DEAD/DEAH box helicase n=1 Tax=Streptomyces sp. CB02923 TaxID=1718985 RepID=UPI00093BAC9C|nr:DEAD/DEAH box helicase [Streptomyces sp. CB02923]OKI09638.1 DEAD/DEAH box helicase [Streptomyces sp. CB02923]